MQETLRDPSVRPDRAWRDALTRGDVQDLLRTNNWRAWLSIGLDWGLVFGSMAMVAAWPNFLTVLLAVLVIGARQLGFAVLMHEAAHNTLFKNRKLNDWVGNWLCAFPIWTDLHPYRSYHLQHHAKNWTADDPDLNLAVKHPVTAASMRRKLWRDLSGQVGWKRVKAVLRRDLSGTGFSKRRQDTGVTFGKTAAAGASGWENLRGVVITNAALLFLLTAVGQPALYLLWVVAWFTTNSLVTRLRAIAEHNMVPDRGDELRNTRTMLARWWERLLIAPNRVNYHLEHHLLMTVPFYNLPRMHKLLRDRGALDGALVENSYLQLLIRAGSKPEATEAAAA